MTNTDTLFVQLFYYLSQSRADRHAAKLETRICGEKKVRVPWATSDENLFLTPMDWRSMTWNKPDSQMVFIAVAQYGGGLLNTLAATLVTLTATMDTLAATLDNALTPKQAELTVTLYVYVPRRSIMCDYAPTHHTHILLLLRQLPLGLPELVDVVARAYTQLCDCETLRILIERPTRFRLVGIPYADGGIDAFCDEIICDQKNLLES